MNHKNVAESFGDALGEIGELLAESEKIVVLMNHDDMHEAISALYSLVFQFLGSAMRWYQASAGKKILDSLTETFYDSLKDQISNIKRLCERIRRQGNFKTQVDIRRISLSTEVNWKANHEQQKKQSIMIKSIEEKVDSLGTHSAIGLRENTQAWYHKKEDDSPTHHSFGK